MYKLTRRAALVGGLVASTLSVIAPAALPLPAVTAAPHLDDPLPGGNQHWRGDNGDTYFELFSMMVTESATHTFWPATEAAVEVAKHEVELSPSMTNRMDLDTALVVQDSKGTDQALRLGYALAMTREHASTGIDAWYAAALAYAGIVPMTATAYEAAYDRLNAVNESWARRQGWLADDGDGSAAPV